VKYFFKILFKLSYVPCYGRNDTKLNISTDRISLILGTYAYLVTENEASRAGDSETTHTDELSGTVNGVTIEWLQYLAEPCVNVLNNYITVKCLFRRLNAGVPSSGPWRTFFPSVP